MRARSLAPLILCVVGVAGCVPSPMIATIRVRPDIDCVSERILSIQLVTPTTASPEQVVCYGVYTRSMLEGSNDELAEFAIGEVTPRQLAGGEVKLILQESGQSRALVLRRDNAAACVHLLELHLPMNLGDARVEWMH